MKQHLARATVTILCVSLISGCGSHQVKEEAYTPSREIIHLKSDLPVVRLWDRWTESADRDFLVDGNKVIESSQLIRFLGEDPAAEVAAQLNSARDWGNVSQISGAAATLSGIFGLVGFIKNDKDEQTFATSTNLVLLGLAVVGTGAAILANGVSNRKVDHAMSLHNSRLWKQADRTDLPQGDAVGMNIQVAF